MTIVAVALAGAIGVLAGYLGETRLYTGDTPRTARVLLVFGALAAAVGAVAGLALFKTFGDSTTAPVTSAMLFTYLAGSSVPIWGCLMEPGAVPTRQIAEMTATALLGCACLATGLIVASAT